MLIPLALAAALTLPDVAVLDLQGHHLTARSTLKTPAVLLIGFNYESRGPVGPWIHYLNERTHGALRVIQVPVLSGVASLAIPMLATVMARRVPREEQVNVWITSERDALVRALAIADPDDSLAIALVDEEGGVRLVVRGAPDETSGQRVLREWERLRGARTDGGR